MKRDDFIKNTVKGIKNENVRSKISSELSDHICTNLDFYKEIGYDDDNAEEKAVECMGEYEELGEQLADVHNTRNHTKGIISTIIMLVLLFIDVNMYSNYDFSEHFSVTFALTALWSLIVLGYSLYNMKRKSSACTLLAIPLSLAVFLPDNLRDAIFDFGVYLNIFERKIYTTSYDDTADYISYAVVAFLGLCTLINFIFTVVYNIKIRNMKNTKRDLKMRRVLQGTSITIICIYAVVTVIGFGFYANIVKSSRENLASALEAAINIEMQIYDNKAYDIVKDCGFVDYYEGESLKENGINCDTVYYIPKPDTVYFGFNYKDSSYAEDFFDKSDIGYYSMDIYPKGGGFYFSNFELYNAFTLTKNEAEALKSTNKKYFDGMNKKEILDFYTSYMSRRTFIEAEETSCKYTLMYTKNRQETISVFLYFVKENLIEIEVE